MIEGSLGRPTMVGKHWAWTWLVRETGFSKSCSRVNYYGFNWHYEWISIMKIWKKVMLFLF